MWWFLAGVGVLVLGGALWARRTFVVVTVEGASMSPTYEDGDRVLVRRVRPGGVVAGQVIVLAPPADPGAFAGRRGLRGLPGLRGRIRAAGRLWLVKRLAAGPGDPVPPGLGPALADAAGAVVGAGRMVVLGDNPGQSYDSRQEGFVAAGRVRGVVLRRL
ncbi:signal peptidase I [Longispora sp. NPDC051575]|uniref:signal peptidase I n=1 Tax=Longispora sp. NPDC051575 TaxID=3154943 RepID=UPI00344856FD